ncbi:MAG: PAS domain S-box protein, partial [Deltaproteobacteria bacterium]|nr:PAS domain S-box protein [Deltaproteobacteria bacterium]
GNYLTEIQAKGAASGVMLVQTKGGEKRLWEYHNTLRTEGIATPIVRGMARDITEHKNAEKALQESENRYRTLVENSNDGIALVKGDIHLYVNQKFLEIFGYNHIEEIVGRPMAITIHPDDRDRVVEMNRRRQTKEGEPSKYEFKGIQKDGSIVYIEVAATKTTYQGEAVSLSYHRDITERKHTEEALRESGVKFRDLYDNAPVGYFEYDAQGRITNVNRTELEMLGYTLDEMIGQPVWKFIMEDVAQDQILAKLAGTIPSEREFERTYRRKNGSILPVLAEDRLLRDSEGRIAGIRCTIQDITERKRSEEEKASLQEQLRQSQKIEAIGRLSGGIAHDFNNILTIISGNAQLSLLDLKQGDPLRANIEEIKRASERAADLTRQLLAFSRKQMMEMKVLDLNLIVQ